MNKAIIIQECNFKAVRSSGAGGQHVNKVSSKIELSFDLPNSNGLSAVEKTRLQKRLHAKLTKDGVLLLQCSESRSQHRNKDLVVKRFIKVITQELIIPKKRIKTNIPKSVIRKRLKSKKLHAEKKKNRKKSNLD